jgi:Tol biopolymer transport system component
VRKLLKVLLLGCVLTLAAAVPALAQVSVEGERFNKPSGVSVAGGNGYSGGKALRIFSEKASATRQVTITETSNVLVRARAGQTGGSPTLTIRVDGDNAGTLRITSASLADYLYSGITLQPGTYTIGLKGGDLAQGRNVYVDVVSFPSVVPPSPPPASGKIVYRGDNVLHTINPDGTDKVNLGVEGTHPSWSPDGSRIAFADHSGIQDIKVINHDGSGLVNLTADMGENFGATNPDWSPDGDQIAFEVAESGAQDAKQELYIMNADGSNKVRLTTHVGADEDVAWSPSGDKLVFSREACTGTNCSPPDLYTINPDGTGLALLLSEPGVGHVSAAWSPDGSTIIYRRVASTGSAIYKINPDGTNHVQLVGEFNGGSIASGLSWSPDGSQIVFPLRGQFGNPDLWRMTADGSRRAIITDTPSGSSDQTSEYLPDWGPLPPVDTMPPNTVIDPQIDEGATHVTFYVQSTENQGTLQYRLLDESVGLQG